MKKISFAILLFIAGPLALCQTPTEDQKLYYTCKVWGFIKYFHSRVSNCEGEWDSIGLQTMPLIRMAATADAFNDALDTLILAAGPMEVATTPSPDTLPAELTRNRKFSWMDDPLLREDVRSKLRFIRDNFRPHPICWVNDSSSYTGWLFFPNDRPCIDVDASKQLPDESSKTLMLFKFWNIIAYFNPNNYLVDVPWDSTLSRNAVAFVTANTYLKLYTAMKRMTAALNDAHTEILTGSTVYDVRGTMPKLILRWFGDAYYVVKSGFSELAAGDKITAIDGRTIAQWEDSIRPIMSAGNPAVFRRMLCSDMLSGPRGSAMRIEYRDSRDSVRTLTTYRYTDITSSWFLQNSSADSLYGVTWRRWKCDVGYVNLGTLMPSDVAGMYDSLRDTRAIIFDVRNYPNGTAWEIADLMYPRKMCYTRVTYPDTYYPGTCINGTDSSGTDNPAHPYSGKVIILCNAETQSHAEWTCMMLQAMPRAVVVGSQTAGADGNVTWFFLTHDLQAGFTTLGVYYPDGTQTQRIGIVPDSLVIPTVAGLREGRDEMLEKALEIAQCSATDAPQVLLQPSESMPRLIRYPNPFTTSTTLTLSQPATQPVVLKIFDAYGREVLDLSGEFNGRSPVTLHDRQLPSSGVYFCRLQIGLETRTSVLDFLK